MKPLFLLAILLVLPMAGCQRVASNSGSAGKENPADATSAPPIPVTFTPQTGNLTSSEDVPLLEQINRENVKVLGAALPAIVRITASRPVDPHMDLYNSDIPFQFHFGHGDPHHTQQMDPSFGSGVVISKDGYIVTNNHVIDGAGDVVVQLKDSRSFPARVVAADGPLDVAVLKIDATDLAALPWGNSDKVRVGEQVFAIGNPFNLEDSASKGIVSATGRNLPDSNGYENYIQTDAAINPGNSGGALIDIYGELIGINTAIASTSRGNMGVGFAIPSNMVRYAVENLLKQGHLVRGYLGVMLPESVDDGVADVLHLGSAQGALLAGVQPQSPAAVAGLRAGDFITQVDGQKITDTADLRRIVAQLPIGKQVTVNYIREGTPQTTTVKIGELVAHADGPENPEAESATAPAVTENVLNGLQVSDINDKTRQKYGLETTTISGVLITGVEEDSMADAKGLETGDVIESACINRGTTKPLSGARDFSALAKTLKSDQSVVLLVHHGKASSFVFLAPQK